MIHETLDAKSLDMAKVQSEFESDLLDLPHVVGVSLGHNIKDGKESKKSVISILVSEKVEEDQLSEAACVPKKIRNFDTDVVEVGHLMAGDLLPAVDTDDDIATNEFVQSGSFSASLKRRIRPAMGGFSVGHYKITAGTLGTCCYDARILPGMPRKYYILSNNHVLANSNQARIGDPILQPGRYDGGGKGDVIARLSRFVPIKFISGSSAPCNYVDAAIAEGNLQDLNREIYWGGYVKRLYTAPKVGDIVQKTGRTTGFTTGRVTNINATVNVNFGSGRVAKFCRQIITTPMSQGGDSGSLVCDREERAVGLLFAGSQRVTILNNILFVQRLLGVRITEI